MQKHQQVRDDFVFEFNHRRISTEDVIAAVKKFQTAQKNTELFLPCCSCNVLVVRKVLNPYIIYFKRYKKEKLEKVKRV
jgi:hypothetical protein